MTNHRPRLRATASSSISTARLIPSARRQAWESELVRFQIDELNSLFDALACAPTPARREALIVRARARIEPVLQAASWIPAAVASAVRAIVLAGFDEPEDAFGAALLLAGLGPRDLDDHDWVDQWLPSLPAEVVGLLAELGFDPRRRR
jgi:hypothetical protein